MLYFIYQDSLNSNKKQKSLFLSDGSSIKGRLIQPKIMYHLLT